MGQIKSDLSFVGLFVRLCVLHRASFRMYIYLRTYNNWEQSSAFVPCLSALVLIFYNHLPDKEAPQCPCEDEDNAEDPALCDKERDR